MVITQPIATMTSQRRLAIKTHAAFGVGIGMQIIDILPNKSQVSDFLNMVQSERFTVFSGEGK
jgi:DNA-directed RNA polymerase subunit E'/Rpb7